LVLANAFFVAAEFALVGVRRSRIEQLIKEGNASAKVVYQAVLDLDRYIAGTQLGITIASIGLGWVGEETIAKLVEPLFAWTPTSTLARHSIAVAVSFFLVTFLHVVLGELVPKSLALQNPEGVALGVGRPMRLVVQLFRPFIWMLNGVGVLVLKAFGFSEPPAHHAVHSVEELDILVRQSHQAGVIDDFEQQIMHRAFQFSELTAYEVMIHRSQTKALDLSKDIETVLEEAVSSPYTRLPVYEENIDNIIGVLHQRELLKRIYAGEEISSEKLRNLLHPPLFIPETTHLDDLLEAMREHHTQLAIVIDEHGGTSGIVTLEDIIEEIVGEFQDEYEVAQPPIKESGENQFLIRGEVRLDELKDRFGWEFGEEEEDVGTIAGYVMNRLDRTARVGDEVEAPFGKIRVENMARLRITLVSVTLHESPVPSEDTEEAKHTEPTETRNVESA
ncbi:MAG: HlyC/CorC family transporter, partial [Deltaproteobacteria bacterium]